MGRLMPVILLVEILLITLFGDVLATPLLSFLYAISLTIRQLLSYLLPAIIFGLIFSNTFALIIIFGIDFKIRLSNNFNT